MHLEILQVPDCPNVQLLEQRIEHVLAEESIDWELRHVIVDDPRSARLAGMTGSPTLLVDGRDPFAEPDQVPTCHAGSIEIPRARSVALLPLLH